MAEISNRPTIVDLESDIPAPRTGENEACLVIIYGRELGKRIAVRDEPLVYGRDETCEVCLPEETVSRRHAVLHRDGEEIIVRDLGSTNGIRVNGAATREAVLCNGDQIKIGHTVFKFLQGNDVELKYHVAIYEMMQRDGLTGAHNRRSFDERLAAESERAVRYRRPVGLIYIDVDHFKRLNDTYGHLAGDEVLRQLVDRIQVTIRAQDTLARIGGEEFAVIVPEGTPTGCFLLAERLRKIVNGAAFEAEDNTLNISCSFGVAWMTACAPCSRKALLQAADEALYAAKAGGRNRVEPQSALKHDTS
jgi:diguanylate cyclase (GGDEF)-like protein